MKNFLHRSKGMIILLGLLFSFGALSAQTTITVGSGTTSNTGTTYPTPYGNWYWGNRVQLIYRATELTAAGASAGSITSISFNITALNAVPALNDFEIKMKNSTTNDLSAAWEGGMTTVLPAATYTPTSTGWNTHTLSTPFMWDGSSNLIVEICTQNTGFISDGNASVQWTTGLPTGTSRTYRMDAAGICSNTATSNLNPTNRPDAQFTIISGPCTSPPVAGSTAGPDSVCPAQMVNLSLAGGTAGTGQSWQWQESFDGVTWTNRVNDTLPGLSTTIAVPTHFRCIVTCSNNSATSSPKFVFVKSFIACYCPSTATSTTYGYIQEVNLASISNMSPTGCGQQYTDYTSISTNLIASVSYPMTIDVQGCSGGNFTHSTKVWIDFNQNGSFLDPGEEVLVESPHQYGVVTGTFTVPTTNIVPGPTLMRVVTVETGVAASVTPCGTYTWGETEDYTINIIADTCTAPVFIGPLMASDPTVCPGVTSIISAPNMNMGILQSYQWQESADSLTWTNIPGATNPTYSASSGVDMFYRLQSTCNSQTTISDPIKITISGDPLRGVYTINQLAAPSATNFPSFEDFVFALNCGGVDSVVIANVVPGTGPYNEQIVFEEIFGTSATNTITINGNGNTLTYLSTENDERYTIAMLGASYLTIDSLNIIAEGGGTGEFGWGIWMAQGANNNTLKNSTIEVDTTQTLTNYAGIVLGGSATSSTTQSANPPSHNTIENNMVIGGYYGLCVLGQNPANPGEDNHIIGNTFTNYRFYGGYLASQDGLHLKGNTFTRGDRYFSGFITYYGLFFTNTFTNTEIVGNRIYNSCENCDNVTSAQYATYFSGSSGTAGNENLFANNIISDINGDGNAYGIYAFANDYWNYYHNHIVMDDANAASPTTYAVYSSGSTANSSFKNNIISADRGGNVYGYYLITANNPITIDYNGIHVPNGNVGRSGTTDYATFAAWQAATAYDANSQDAPPMFVDPANFDYAPGSPAYSGQGDNLLAIVPTDYFGVTRTTTPDLGAIEFVPQPCAGPFGFGNDSVTSSSGFFTWDSFENNWVIEWGPVGFLPGSAAGTQVGATTNNFFEVTGLQSNTCYDFFVAEICGSDTSIWTGPVTICTPKAHDAALLGFVEPNDRDCGDDNMDVQVEIRNNAYFPITSVPVTVEITGAITQTLTATYTGNLTMGQTDVFTVGQVDLEDGGIIDLMAYVQLPNDEDSTNDSTFVQDVRIIPAEPRIENLPFCAGDDSVTLFGVYLPQLVTYGWYNAATGGTLLSNSDTITVAASMLPNLWLGYDSVPNAAGNRNYCASNATATTYSYIENVTFGSINVTSPTGCGQTYTDNTAFSTAVNLGGTYQISVDVQNCSGGQFNNSTKVYIDYNGNGSFADPGEEVAVFGPHFYGPQTANITIPMSATPGLTTTMRVVNVETGSPAGVNPCGTFTWGETEDYTIEILGGVACSPNRTQANLTADSVPVASYIYNILPNLEIEVINTSTPAGTNATWDFGGLGTATGDTAYFTFPQAGNYQICLTASNFCSSDNSCETINVFGIGVETFAFTSLEVFPNPNDGRFSLRFNQEFVSDVKIELLDLSGKAVYTEVYRGFSGSFSKDFDNGRLASGSYMLRLRNERGTVTKRIVINK